MVLPVIVIFADNRREEVLELEFLENLKLF